ncbi:glycoside hydrolase family 16 protein [Botryobasidium botryosum FD-172 SS1]|uniref:Glycoside hydrolase family 16 protein n=1 Tax=Botryobasidium botryosum (strain FD-172 SS1) TaxID=930990 RepID=A0A067MMX7_BOTB1|nr:glycoside hydrolase family 16 protein [Botryobasidium botryosum FD-172 SS1]
MFITAALIALTSLGLGSDAQSCPCGYRDSNGAVWRESFVSDFTSSYTTAINNWNVQTWGGQRGSYFMQNTAANVYPYNSGVGLKTSAYTGGGTIKVAEIDSKKQNILYGSFRIRATVPSTPGVCFGFFTYQSDTQEADIEILTSDSEYYRTAHYTNQPGLLNGNTDPQAAKTLVLPAGTDFTAFGEHRFDWTPGTTKFYYNNALQTTIAQNAPTQPSTLILNVWSSGDPGWTKGPPTADAVSTVQYIKVRKITIL